MDRTGSSDETRNAGTPRHFDIVVAPGFVLLELASLVEVLRLANRVCPRPPFTYAYRSLRGGPVASSSGATVPTDAVSERPRADYLFVIGNSDPDMPDLSLGRIVSDYTYRGAQVFLLAEAASRYIDEQGTDDLATHWENASFLRERGARFQAKLSLATARGAVVTCAGDGGDHRYRAGGYRPPCFWPGQDDRCGYHVA